VTDLSQTKETPAQVARQQSLKDHARRAQFGQCSKQFGGAQKTPAQAK
jgi:hypothetical protein